MHFYRNALKFLSNNQINNKPLTDDPVLWHLYVSISLYELNGYMKIGISFIVGNILSLSFKRTAH